MNSLLILGQSVAPDNVQPGACALKCVDAKYFDEYRTIAGR